jgi:replication initiator protein
MAGAIFLGVLPVWASLRQRALDKAIAEIHKKMDLNIALESLERSRHRWVTTLIFAIKPQAVTNGD